MRKIFQTVLLIAIFSTISFEVVTSVNAQSQSFDFSGNKPESYQCIVEGGQVQDLEEAHAEAGTEITQDAFGKFLCPPDSNGVVTQAVLKPPTLQILEIWFLRLLYIIWALVGAISFLLLVVLGYRYMLTRGDVTKITEIRQRIIYYIVGLALTFLAVPILSTTFRLLSINDDVACYDVEMPGFNFFFSELCTDPRGIVTNPCEVGDLIANAIPGEEYPCGAPGTYKVCPGVASLFTGILCDKDTVTWRTYTFPYIPATDGYTLSN